MLFHHLFKLVLANAAERANPIVGYVFESCARSDASVRVANSGVIHPLANYAIVLFHVIVE